jgi:FKBP-type peptidyl-prolyl cis-trans isomerase SlpA
MSQLITSSAQQRIGLKSRVTLHFSVLLPSGEEVDTTRRGRPASFSMGDGNLLPGFESALQGMKAGDDAQLELAPSQAFGERNPKNVQVIDSARFAGMPLEPGLMVSFAAADGELPGVVLRVFESAVEVDFNHPLAGRHVVFDVSVLAVEG